MSSYSKNIGINSDDLDMYIRDHSSAEDPVLYDLYRRTHLKLYHPRRSSDHFAGQFLSFISQLVKPRRILEIGTYSGYGSICLAKGLVAEGILHTIEINDEIEDFIKESFSNARISDRVILHIGDACEIIPTIDEEFDLIFIDGNKDQYSKYFDSVINKVKPGGFIIADNVLWDGKVLTDNIPNNDPFTKGIQLFNNKIQADKRVENLLLPLYDGLMMIRKK